MIPAKYGIYQLVGDTGGPAGMMMGLRSIPIYLSICREMEKRCPEVVVLNHSNPMAVLCRAMLKYTGIRKVIGICHGVQGGIMQTAELLGVEPEELEVVWIGTNHYYWFTRIRLHGKDVYPEVMAQGAEAQAPARRDHGRRSSPRSTATASSTRRTATIWSSTPSWRRPQDPTEPPLRLRRRRSAPATRT